MRWLLFLSRLAFICGLFFLLTVSLEIKEWTTIQSVTSTIFIIGVILGSIIIPVVNICYLVVLIARKHLSPVPLWLSLANLLFLFMQVFFLFYLNIHK